MRSDSRGTDFLFPQPGPGCSSVGYGAASELGPLLVNDNGTGLEFNKFSWNRGLPVISPFLLLEMLALTCETKSTRLPLHVTYKLR